MGVRVDMEDMAREVRNTDSSNMNMMVMLLLTQFFTNCHCHPVFRGECFQLVMPSLSYQLIMVRGGMIQRLSREGVIREVRMR